MLILIIENLFNLHFQLQSHNMLPASIGVLLLLPEFRRLFSNIPRLSTKSRIIIIIIIMIIIIIIILIGIYGFLLD